SSRLVSRLLRWLRSMPCLEAGGGPLVVGARRGVRELSSGSDRETGRRTVRVTSPQREHADAGQRTCRRSGVRAASAERRRGHSAKARAGQLKQVQNRTSGWAQQRSEEG